jgi:hypothetical protein
LSNSSLISAGNEYAGSGSPFGALPNEFNGIAIEQLMPPGVIEEYRHQVPDFGARASPSRQIAEPSLDLNRAHFTEAKISPRGMVQRLSGNE